MSPEQGGWGRVGGPSGFKPCQLSPVWGQRVKGRRRFTVLVLDDAMFLGCFGVPVDTPGGEVFDAAVVDREVVVAKVARTGLTIEKHRLGPGNQNRAIMCDVSSCR